MCTAAWMVQTKSIDRKLFSEKILGKNEKNQNQTTHQMVIIQLLALNHGLGNHNVLTQDVISESTAMCSKKCPM